MTADLVADVGVAVASGGEVDDVLRSVVARIAAEPGIAWAGVAFVEGDALVLGPSAGEPDEQSRMRIPVRYEAVPVAELWVDGRAEAAALEDVCALIAEPCLVGWDTGGEPWDPT